MLYPDSTPTFSAAWLTLSCIFIAWLTSATLSVNLLSFERLAFVENEFDCPAEASLARALVKFAPVLDSDEAAFWYEARNVVASS